MGLYLTTSLPSFSVVAGARKSSSNASHFPVLQFMGFQSLLITFSSFLYFLRKGNKIIIKRD